MEKPLSPADASQLSFNKETLLKLSTEPPDPEPEPEPQTGGLPPATPIISDRGCK